MGAKTFTTPGGEKIVMLSEADYEALVVTAEDATDAAAVAEYDADVAAGRALFLPLDMVERILGGASRVREFRKCRAMTQAQLAEAAGLTRSAISRIEAGRRKGSISTYVRLANALGVDIDDLAPIEDESAT